MTDNNPADNNADDNAAMQMMDNNADNYNAVTQTTTQLTTMQTKMQVWRRNVSKVSARYVYRGVRFSLQRPGNRRSITTTSRTRCMGGHGAMRGNGTKRGGGTSRWEAAA
jgi:hypothetical protein